MVCFPPYKMVKKKKNGQEKKNGPKNSPVHILPYALVAEFYLPTWDIS